MLLIDVLKVKEVGVHGDGELESQLSECLSQAHSLAAQEWIEGQRVSLASIWASEVGRVRVEPLGDVLPWLLPLIWVLVDHLHVDEEGDAWLNGDPVDSASLSHSVGGGDSDWSVIPHGLIVGVLGVDKVLCHLVREVVHPVTLDLLNKRV